MKYYHMHILHTRRPFRKHKLNYIASLVIINLQYISTLRGFDEFVGWGWGPSAPRSSSASHLYWAPSSALSGRIRSVTVSSTGVLMVSVKVVWFSRVCPLYHLTVRYWTGATSWTSHWSVYCSPSVIGPLWSTVLMNTLSGVSVEEDLHTLKSAVMNVHLLDITENEQKNISKRETHCKQWLGELLHTDPDHLFYSLCNRLALCPILLVLTLSMWPDSGFWSWALLPHWLPIQSLDAGLKCYR